ncbi:hypothetical protein BKA70DRAFT_1403400 [Coprinopsis sp. MPI-PUGE-AT-0042]|nr:hypothetical protein BKA70DRAFT_1403400 [Coprinopsis sp. MPI-PUGE-AT-0042]
MFFSLSFVKASIFAAVALPSVLAAPISAPIGVPVDVPVGAVSTLQGVNVGPTVDVGSIASGILRREDGQTPSEVVQSVPDVLSSLLAQLTPATGDLNALVAGKTKDQVNVEDVTLSLQNIEGILTTAVATVKTIVSRDGVNAEVPLTLGGERITLIDVAQLVSAILNIVLSVLVTVLRLVGSLPVIQALLTFIGNLLAELLTVVFGIIPGLQPVVASVLGTVVGLLKVLDFVTLGKVISIDLTKVVAL